MEGYPEPLGEILSVLIVHFETQKSASGAVNDGHGKEVFHTCLSAASSIITSHGGSLLQSSGNTLQGCFNDSKDAVRAAIAIHHLIETEDNDKKFQDKIHMKAGVDFGEVIRSADDMHGSAVETARLLKNIASPDEIIVSSQVFNFSRDLPSVHFEQVHAWNKKNVPREMEIYRILWDTAHKTGAIMYPILYFRPVWKLWETKFTDAWDEVLRSNDALWGDKHESKTILKDKSIVIILKHIDSVISLSIMVNAFLKKKLGSLGNGLVPLQIIADIGHYGKDWTADTENIPPLWAKLSPGYLYISENAFNSMQQKTDIQGNPLHRSYGAQSFYQIALDNEQPQAERSRFIYQSALAQGDLRPCYYCGSKKHRPVNCLSKNIPEATNALDMLGYLSIDELNKAFHRHIMGESENDEDQYRVNLLTEGSLGLAESGFFEVKRIFQLRFFRSFWNTTHEEWRKIRRNQNQSEGGLIWLAQDSLRVSELTKAESILTNAMDKYPLDYRVYVAAGFLNIDKNDLPRAEYYFTEALSTAKTNTQKVYALLLLSRLYWVTGNVAKAYEKIQRAFNQNVDSVDVLYQDIVFKFVQGKEKYACQRLSRLVQEDRTFFVTALIDPDLAPYLNAIGETLGTILDRTRKEAQSAVTDANNEYDLSRVALGKNANNDIQFLRAEIDELMDKDSYFGYLDVINHCNVIISTCRNSTIHRKREIWEIIHELSKRLEKNMSFVDSYPYQGMVRYCREQLAHARDKIHRVQSIGPALSQEQLIACNNLKDELTEEWNTLECRLKRLDIFQKFCRGSLRFLRWSGIFMAIVWFLDLFLFPLIIYYLNAFLSGFDVSTIPNVWFYQKNFLLFGSLTGMSVALFITIKNFFKK